MGPWLALFSLEDQETGCRSRLGPEGQVVSGQCIPIPEPLAVFTLKGQVESEASAWFHEAHGELDGAWPCWGGQLA